MSVRKKHIVLRTCVVCGKKTDKRDLLRIVATKDGFIEVDPTGKMNGRGAYVCRHSGDCAGSGLKRNRLEYALRTKISSEVWTSLMEISNAVGTAA